MSPAKLCKKMQEVKHTWPDRHSNLQFTDGFSNEFSIFVGFSGGSSLGFAALESVRLEVVSFQAVEKAWLLGGEIWNPRQFGHDLLMTHDCLKRLESYK